MQIEEMQVEEKKEEEKIEFIIGDKVTCPFIRSEEAKDDAEKATGTILQTRTVVEQSDEIIKYYIHFDGKDKRHDRWVKADYLNKVAKPIEIDPVPADKEKTPKVVKKEKAEKRAAAGTVLTRH